VVSVVCFPLFRPPHLRCSVVQLKPALCVPVTNAASAQWRGLSLPSPDHAYWISRRDSRSRVESRRIRVSVHTHIRESHPTPAARSRADPACPGRFSTVHCTGTISYRIKVERPPKSLTADVGQTGMLNDRNCMREESCAGANHEAADGKNRIRV
jgi:hypothetical protein